MVWSQVSIKIPRANFGNTVLDNSNLDKISHSLAKTDLYLGQSVTFFEMKKKKKKRIVSHVLPSKHWYISQTYTIPKLIKKEIEKTMAQLSIWICALVILEI